MKRLLILLLLVLFASPALALSTYWWPEQCAEWWLDPDDGVDCEELVSPAPPEQCHGQHRTFVIEPRILGQNGTEYFVDCRSRQCSYQSDCTRCRSEGILRYYYTSGCPQIDKVTRFCFFRWAEMTFIEDVYISAESSSECLPVP